MAFLSTIECTVRGVPLTFAILDCGFRRHGFNVKFESMDANLAGC